MDIVKAIKEYDVNLVKTLLQTGANVDLQDKDNKTALMEASWYGNTECVELLLQAGANPNLQDHCGWTSLMYASRRHHYNTYNNLNSSCLEIIKILLQSGANVNLQCKYKYTVLMEAICNYTALKGASLNYNKKIVKILKRMIIMPILNDY